MNKPYVTCPDCIEYAEVRRPAIVPALAERTHETGESSQQILDRFMAGVHARHMSGLPILPRSAA